MKLSVIMPVYNERATLREVVRKVLSVPMEIELICVDDGSRDGSREILAELQAPPLTCEAVITEVCWHLRHSTRAVARVLTMPSRGDLLLLVCP